MSSSRHKHLVEGELSMQILLDHVHPLRVSCLAVELLGKYTRGRMNECDIHVMGHVGPRYGTSLFINRLQEHTKEGV